MELARLLTALVVLLSHRRSWASHPKPSCPYPPSQWCRSLEIAIECKVQKQCMEVRALRLSSSGGGGGGGVPPLAVTLYYESLCPACRLFITQQLFPTWSMLRDIMTVTLVPYGNAKERPTLNSPFTCQHGQPECDGNMIEACMIHLTGNAAFQIIYCMESSANVLAAAQPCLELYAPAVPWNNVTSCAMGELGHRLMHANAVMTRALNPAHTHVPWVTFDGEYTEDHEDRAMSSLFQLVCKLYKGVKPPACTGAPIKLDRSFC